MVKEVGPLLKSYQEEIDRLTGRAKLGESAFLDVYQRLYEAPDPAAALMAGLVRRSDAMADFCVHTLTFCCPPQLRGAPRTSKHPHLMIQQ